MEDDPLLNFFDLSKKFERITLTGTQTRGRIKYDEAALLPPPMMEEDEPEEADAREYWRKYKEKEELDLLHLVMEERTGGGATARGGQEGSFMSGLDANTVVSGSVSGKHPGEAGGSGRPGMAADDLLQKYDFSVHCRTEKLHISVEKERIIDVISNNQVTIISGFTGCGKTTQIPQYILEHYATRPGSVVNIVVTQPRRIAAQSVARRVCEERNWPLGRLVGYKVGMDKEQCSTDTRLLYCTTGVLKKMIIGRKALNEWTHVILDEVHEREEDMDFLLLLCKKLINSNSRGVKLILMSATIAVDDFQDYFKWPVPGTDNFITAESYQIAEKRRHTVKEFFASDLLDMYNPDEPPDLYEGPKLYSENVNLCKKIIAKIEKLESTDAERRERKNKGTVLVFLPGEAEILAVQRALKSDLRLLEEFRWTILPLHSRIPQDDIKRVFDPPHNGERKIILATNIAESSITIPDVEYVIDFCLTKYLVADPETNYVSLQLQWTDKQSMIQRKGRCGRVKNGRAFALITKQFFNDGIPDRHQPEMTRAPLDKVILDTKLLDFGSPKELLALAMDPPDLNNIHKTVMHLKQIGALLTTVNNVSCKDDGDLTILGELIAGLPVDVRMGKLIIFGHLFDVLDECVIIAAGLSNKSIFATPMEKKLPAYANKLVWADRSFSDCLAVLIAYTTYQKYKRQGHFERAVPGAYGRRLEQEWCRARFLQMKCLRDVEITKDEITRGLKRKGIEKFPTPNRPPLTWPEKCRYLQFCIFGAFYPNYFVRRHGGVDLKEVHKTINGKDPMTTVYLTGFPQDQAKVGSLYTESIKQLFQDCADPERIDVEFEGNKVIVQFSRMRNELNVEPEQMDRDIRLLNEHTNLTGEIIHQVYVAMKLKQMPRDFMAINVYKSELAEKKFSELEESRAMGMPQQKWIVDFATIGRVPPPKLNIQKCRFAVVHVNDPNSIWVQYSDRDHEDQLMQLEKAIQGALGADVVKKHPRGKQDLVKNGVYLAPYEDDDEKEHYRARIDRICQSRQASEHDVVVSFIDYGNTAVLRSKDLVIITPDMLANFPALTGIKALALECSLTGIKPNPVNSVRGFWGDESIAFVRDKILRRNIEAEIYSVLPQADSPLLSITVVFEGKNLIEELKKPRGDKEMALAVEASESYLSDMNHDYRRKCLSYTPEWREKLEEMQVHSFSTTQGKASGSKQDDEAEKRVRAQLRGPIHPLEFKIASAHRIGSTKEVRIEQDSVNSVLLDRYPTDNHDQWMVAGHVGMNPSGNSLMLRSTTFLPNQYGLGALLTMIFAPFVEMRCDQRRKRYTGFIAGLGYRDRDWGVSARMGSMTGKPPGPKVSYFGEHDMEVQLDVGIDNEDIQLVNKIRFYINYALTPDSFAKGNGAHLSLQAQQRERILRIANASTLVDIQANIQMHLTKLLCKPRESRDKQGFHRENCWMELPKNEHLLVTNVSDTAKHVFKMITGINLRKSPNREDPDAKTLKAVQRLHDLARKQFTELDEACPICSGVDHLRTSAEVLQHITGKRHHQMLENL